MDQGLEMGYRIAKACDLLIDAELSERSRVVLSRMAWHTLDKPNGGKPAGEYYGGWEWLGMPWDDGKRDKASVKRIVMRSLAELARRGYITPIGIANHGRRQHYRIEIGR